MGDCMEIFDVVDVFFYDLLIYVLGVELVFVCWLCLLL